MNKKTYGVVILNYNTAADAIQAAQSVIDCAESEDYVICIADNRSTKEGEVEMLSEARLPRCEILPIARNRGYACGNNEAIRYLRARYDVDYLVIMNPDVLLLRKGTIDRLVKRLAELPGNYAGVQPMVWTPYLGEATTQTHIRRIQGTYANCLINHSIVLKRLCRDSHERSVYKKERPYRCELDFEVPSGAFFITRTGAFEKVGLFDERTFLYGEEMMLGYKLKQAGYTFRFLPAELVQHEGGKSIGSNARQVKWNAVKYAMDALEIYLRHYLHCNPFQISFVKSIMALDWFMKKLSYIFFKRKTT